MGYLMYKVSGDYACGRGSIIVGKPVSHDGPIRRPKPKPKPDKPFITEDEMKL